LRWVFLPTKKHVITILFVSTLFKYVRHFDYWNQPLDMRIRVCYLHCHEAGLCCYLLIHTENLLRLLQLFYFHLWPVYWLSLVYRPTYRPTAFQNRFLCIWGGGLKTQFR
jgi:hypothetical protein